MSVDEFDISDEERERRRDEAGLIARLILSADGSPTDLDQPDIDRALGL